MISVLCQLDKTDLNLYAHGMHQSRRSDSAIIVISYFIHLHSLLRIVFVHNIYHILTNLSLANKTSMVEL